MKKRFKFTSIILAVLFATAPVFSLKASVPNTTQAASTITKKNVITHFLGERNIYINSTKINGSALINNISLVNNSGTEIETNDTVLTDGKYTLKAQATVIGLTPTSTDRSIIIANNNGEILGSANVSAHGTIAQGGIEFDFTIKNGKLSCTSLGNVAKNTKKTTKKKAKKRNKKVTHKRSHKKLIRKLPNILEKEDRIL